MVRITAVLFVILLLAGTLLPGCSKDEVLDVYGAAVAAFGNVGLDSALSLKGEREFGEDKYTGTYAARYEDFTGMETPFRGTMLEHRSQEHVTVTCAISGTGKARLRWNCGAEEPILIADGEGEVEKTVYLAPGSNYFNLEFENFTGSVELEIA